MMRVGAPATCATTLAPARSVKGRSHRSRLWLFLLFGALRHRRRRQCGQSHRRSRRPRHRAGDDRGRRPSRIIAYLAGNAIFANYLGINYVPGAGELAVVLRRADRRAASASCGSTRRRRRSSWATPARWRSAACSAPSPWRSSTRSCWPSSAACSCWRPCRSSSRWRRFKLTGKRVFRMAPIHHHFEQMGWSEPQVVMRFWIIAFVLALVGLSTLKVR